MANISDELIEAAKAGETDVVQTLLSQFTDINTKDNLFGRTALMWAAREGQTTTVQVLLG